MKKKGIKINYWDRILDFYYKIYEWRYNKIYIPSLYVYRYIFDPQNKINIPCKRWQWREYDFQLREAMFDVITRFVEDDHQKGYEGFLEKLEMYKEDEEKYQNALKEHGHPSIWPKNVQVECYTSGAWLKAYSQLNEVYRYIKWDRKQYEQNEEMYSNIWWNAKNKHKKEGDSLFGHEAEARMSESEKATAEKAFKMSNDMEDFIRNMDKKYLKMAIENMDAMWN